MNNDTKTRPIQLTDTERTELIRLIDRNVETFAGCALDTVRRKLMRIEVSKRFVKAT